MHHTAEEPSIDFSTLKVKIASKMSNCEENFPCDSSLENSPLAENLGIQHSVTNVLSTEINSPIICSTPKMSSTPKKSSEKRRRIFTPKTRKNRILCSQIYYLKQKLNGYKNPSDAIKSIKKIVSPEIYSFICSQMENANISRYARRWKIADKDLALKLFLASPKSYSVLHQHFYFPSRKTVLKSISGLNVEPGFCMPVLKAFLQISQKMKNRDKYCALSFDEMKLKKGLHYYRKLDYVVGYENYGQYTPPDPEPATHALLFMVRGICRMWKQVFGIFFCKNSTNANVLKHLVLDAVNNIKESGLIPVSTVCDQGANNIKLYIELGVTKEKPFFMVNDVKIYATFDPPHLLKSLRNNFKNYKVRFYDFKEKHYKCADWQHICQIYAFDKDLDHRGVPKLTEKHLSVDGLDKMNVALAAQIFSNSVASTLMYWSMLPEAPSSAAHTADFVSKINFIFDSVNSRKLRDKKNPYLCACTKTSYHHQFWDESIKFMETVQFVTEDKEVHFNCIDGWIQTLRAYRMMTQELLEEIPFILMSRFNQDALENFFSQVNSELIDTLALYIPPFKL